MRKLRSTYVHRGDALRRRNRLKWLAAWTTIALVALYVIANRALPVTPVAEAAAAAKEGIRISSLWESSSRRRAVENAAGEATVQRAVAERQARVSAYSAKYRISSKLAATIFDVALEEGLDPELAFRLVELESHFNPRAVSKVGAIGLAQLMPSTAQQIQRGVTKEKLYDPRTNVRIGFRHLRALIADYDGNVRYALLAYNLGGPAVDRARKGGKNPLVGYNRILLKDYRGSGVSDN